MPVEIRELIIRAVVDSQEQGGESRSVLSEPEREELIQACVSETLRILALANER